MNTTLFTWYIISFIVGCVIAIMVHAVKKKREERRQAEYIKFMREHNILI